LELSGCRKLVCLPNALSMLQALQSLHLAYCVSLTELPKLPKSLALLDLSYCSSDTIAASLVRAYANLHEVCPGWEIGTC
jgi:hypothetical protein